MATCMLYQLNCMGLHFKRPINFTNILCLHYGWFLPHLPSHCVCSKALTISYALSCPHSTFPIIHYNDVRDLTAKLMSEVCHNVQVEQVELHLQPLSGELLHYNSAVLPGLTLELMASGVAAIIVSF